MALSVSIQCIQNHTSRTIFHSKQTHLITNNTPLTSRNKNRITLRGNVIPKQPKFGLLNNKKQSLVTKHKTPMSIIVLAGDTDSVDLTEMSASDAVKKLYTYINDKNVGQIKELISDNCILEDSAFPYTIAGKRDVVSFFSQFVESMGKNVRFKLGHVCQGKEFIASVDWHLEWEEDPIPLSRGCTIFQFANEGERLVIRKAQIITESPIKPGKLAVAFLHIVTKLFDEFPQVARWFLKSPQTILKALLAASNLLMEPIVSPFLAFYINLWTFIIRVLGYVISIVRFVAKFLNHNSSSGDQSIGSSKT